MADAPISMAEFLHRLQDPAADLSDLKRYVQIDLARSDAFRPRVVVNPALVDANSAETWLGGGLSEIERLKRQRRYRERIAGGWTGRRLVSEGDSWFQYPVLLDDVIDQLEPDNAIFCLSGAGDTLDNIARQDELKDAVVEHRPHAVLLSAGGNDLLGRLRLFTLLKSFVPGRRAADYLRPGFDSVLAEEIGPKFRRLLLEIRSVAPEVPILCHGYGYAIPRAMIWLGLPMVARGIVDQVLQRAIVRVLIDRLHLLLTALAAEPALAPLHIVDCRTAAGSAWFDELHPNNSGFRRVAARFRAALPPLP